MPERLRAVHTESQRHYKKKQNTVWLKNYKKEMEKNHEVEVTPCTAQQQALPKRQEAQPGVRHFPSLGHLQLLGHSDTKPVSGTASAPRPAQPGAGHSPWPRAAPSS